jgi:hypothetical protein
MTKASPRVLFVLKNEPDYSYGYGGKKSSGLYNSALFVANMLNAAGIVSQVSIVTDNNDIDREVSNFKATHVIIEALWVVPSKFVVLKKLHPRVTWIVRIHSEIPFLALDGVAVEWIKQYVQLPNVFVATNSLRTKSDLEIVAGAEILYLPNYYPLNFKAPKKTNIQKSINIGCFGAVRPFKNQLAQAVAAYGYAQKNKLALTFHINSSRVEQNGDNVLKNIRALFAGSPYTLVEHTWFDHAAFLTALQALDLIMTVSFTETFSIVTADAVSQGIPIVTSPEVTWANPAIQADPTSISDIQAKMSTALRTMFFKNITASNQKRLTSYSNNSKDIWLDYLGV